MPPEAPGPRRREFTARAARTQRPRVLRPGRPGAVGRGLPCPGPADARRAERGPRGRPGGPGGCLGRRPLTLKDGQVWATGRQGAEVRGTCPPLSRGSFPRPGRGNYCTYFKPPGRRNFGNGDRWSPGRCCFREISSHSATWFAGRGRCTCQRFCTGRWSFLAAEDLSGYNETEMVSPSRDVMISRLSSLITRSEISDKSVSDLTL